MKLATVINDNGATELGLVNSDATRVARVTMLCEDLGRPAPEWSLSTSCATRRPIRSE